MGQKERFLTKEDEDEVSLSWMQSQNVNLLQCS